MGVLIGKGSMLLFLYFALEAIEFAECWCF